MWYQGVVIDHEGGSDQITLLAAVGPAYLVMRFVVLRVDADMAVRLGHLLEEIIESIALLGGVVIRKSKEGGRSDGSSGVFLHGFGKHELPHPFDTILARIHRKVMVTRFLEELLVFLVLGYQCEGKARFFGGSTGRFGEC